MEQPLIAGAYYQYAPTQHHCREGLAVAKTAQADGSVYLDDLFWGPNGGNDWPGVVSTADELKTAELLFNPADGWHEARANEPTEDMEPDDVHVIHWQHGLRQQLWVRDGAKPSLRVRLERAELDVAEAEAALARAESRLSLAREHLNRIRFESYVEDNADTLVAEAVAEQEFDHPHQVDWLLGPGSELFARIAAQAFLIKPTVKPRLAKVILGATQEATSGEWAWHARGYAPVSFAIRPDGFEERIWDAKLDIRTLEGPSLPVPHDVACALVTAALSSRAVG